MDNPDRFEVIDGPEDGLEFAVTRTPVDLGADPCCAIFLRFDGAVQPVHARITVVPGGYRVRNLSGGPLFVNGKRSGIIRARIVRSGETLRAGATSLCLNCAPDGLASRSLGMPMETNIGWLARMIASGMWKTLRLAGRALFRMPSRLTRFTAPLIVAAIVIAWFRPGFLWNVYYWALFWIRWAGERAGLM